MSLAAMLWALNEAPVKDPAQALVLVALADNASEDGCNAWPALATIAARSRCSVRTVQRRLKELEEAGIIRRSEVVPHARGDRRPVNYDLVMRPARHDNLTGRADAEATAPAVRPDMAPTDDTTPVSTEPSLPNLSQPEPSQALASHPLAVEIDRLCVLLADLVEANGSKRPKVTTAWREECRRMLDLDGRTPEQVEYLVRWSQADPFWRAHVLGMPKLREKFDAMRLVARRLYEERQAEGRSSRVAQGRSVADELRGDGL